MNTLSNPKKQEQNAAGWILKSLAQNTAWFDEIRLAGRKNFEKKYHFIPLIDISLVCERYDINVLKDACYLLKENKDIDIWGDDYEPYGMLVQISDKGLNSCRESYYQSGTNGILKKGVACITALAIVLSLIVGLKKSADKKISETVAKNASAISVAK